MRVERPRVALVGAGRWGRIVLRTLQQLDGVQLSVLATRSADGASLVGPDCAIVPDWREAVTSADVDAVVVTVPPSVHAEVARLALQAGKAVFVEKPLATNVDDARALVQLAAARGLVLHVDHIDLCNPGWRALKQSMPRIGRVRKMHVALGNPGPIGGAGLLWEWGPHGVAMFVDLFGRPQSCAAAAVGERELTLDLEASGASARIEIAAELAAKRRRAKIEGERGELVYDDRSASRLTLDGHPMAVSEGSPLTNALSEFVDAVRDGDASLASGELGVEVVEALSGVESSFASSVGR